MRVRQPQFVLLELLQNLQKNPEYTNPFSVNEIPGAAPPQGKPGKLGGDAVSCCLLTA